ncbi:anti-sigma factor family protein [Amycolatopsis anabasis]|uniref:anti-sigma factor family protein n=1 Tax=Amycolatopsis anabasis TaxID=1840409 RepID=UPI00131B1001|nr:zf-HC2 domain-containing protein [Amycolatopsis anabasis]
MNGHGTPLVGAYALGLLDDIETRETERHLAGCATCRAELAALEEVRGMAGRIPAEALLHGPPDDGDLLLRRTLRQVRSESAVRHGRRRLLAGVAAAVVAAAALGTGVLIGQSPAGPPSAAPPPAPVAEPPAAGTRVLSGTEPRTGARLSVAVVPAAGWVRVNASVTGIPAGERCRLVVVSKDGAREPAAGWLVSPKGAAEGINLDGAALVAPADVAAVEVENVAGTRFVSVSG